MKTTGTRVRVSRCLLRGFACGTVLLTSTALLAGCGSLLGGKKEPTTIYAPEVRAQAAPDWPQVRWQLAIGRATGARLVDSLRIAVRPNQDEVQVYKGAQWAKPPGDMLEDGVLHALEDSGRISGIARQGSGIGADYRLLMDVRRFESDYAGAAVPTATIEVTAKLLHVKSQQLAGTRTFLQTQVASSAAISSVVDAFHLALERTNSEVAEWTLRTGEAYAQESAH